MPQQQADKGLRDAQNSVDRSIMSHRDPLRIKKGPRPEMLLETSQPTTSSTFEDVIFLRLPEVKAITGLSKSSLYGLIRENSFPRPVRLGQRAVAWISSEIKQWAAERVRSSRSVA
jgi:predicted DNA-binding transcriptional regulator AlpA